MKSICFLCVIFLVSFWEIDVSAQVVDMRAYSRRHGFKAYQAKSYKPRSAVQKQPSTVQYGEERKTVKEPQNESKKTDGQKSAGLSDQTQEMQEYIQNNPHVKPDI